MRQALTANTAADEAISVSARPSFLALTLGCIGVVYGDIGTSPLYALRESVLAATNGGHAATEPVILGILSLILWALILIVTVKYVLILLRADNDGEGGTLALMALANRALGGRSLVIILLGIVSAALFYGDALIPPAISVLSAVEGLSVATPALQTYVFPPYLSDSVRVVRGAVSRHNKGRHLLRTDHACLVHCPCHRWACAHRPESRRARRLQSCPWRHVLGLGLQRLAPSSSP